MRILCLLSSLILSGCLSYVDPDLPHMIELSDPPCVKPHHGYRYQTCSDYSINIDGMPFIVPEGFDTDFASIPKFLWWKIAPHEARLVAPSIVHDFMYQCPGDITRKYADNVYYTALIQSGIPAGEALRIYYVVRYAGEPFFKHGVSCEEEPES